MCFIALFVNNASHIRSKKTLYSDGTQKIRRGIIIIHFHIILLLFMKLLADY
jgi:hypothetical protein